MGEVYMLTYFLLSATCSEEPGDVENNTPPPPSNPDVCERPDLGLSLGKEEWGVGVLNNSNNSKCGLRIS